MSSEVPVIDVRPLLTKNAGEAEPVAKHVCETCRGIGFMVVTGLDVDVRLDGSLGRKLLAIFNLPEAEKKKLARRKYMPDNPWIYRGFFLADASQTAFKEGIDIGVHAARWPRSEDPLRENGPIPDETVLPGFGAALNAWITTMERLGNAVLRALAKGAGLDPNAYARAFEHGASTLRLLHYPVRSHSANAEAQRLSRQFAGQERMVGTGEHTDSGGLTLLVQDGVGGLQVQAMDGATWQDVPPIPGSVVVNLGDLMQIWSGGLYRATPHRVLSPGVERFSIPYFYEPRYEAVITPPGEAHFTYREHLVRKIAGFTEFRGVAV